MTVLNNHPAALGQCNNCPDKVYENNGVLYHDKDGNIFCNFKGVPTLTKAELKKEKLSATK